MHQFNSIIVKSIFYIVFLACANNSYAQQTYAQMLEGMYKNTVPLITPDSTNEILKSNEKIYLLDTREKEEFEVSHIKSSRWVGYNTFTKKQVKDIPKDAKIVVYCSVGYRSERIGERLQKLGYKNVVNLYGGIFQWTAEEKPIVDPKGIITPRLHVYDQEWGRWAKKVDKVY